MIMNTRTRQFPNTLSTTELTKLYTLHLLQKKDCHGKELIDTIYKELNYNWKPSPGMVYPLLRALESEGYIEGSWSHIDKRHTRYYRLTEEGYRHLNIIRKNYLDQLSVTRKIIDLTILKLKI